MNSNTLLEYIKRLQAIAQAGITYAENGYDLERYEELRLISVNLMSSLTDEPIEKIYTLFARDIGYQTPKVDVRAAIFRENKILLVRESIDNCWSLPGGWADVGYSPGEVAVKETREEAGLEVKAKRVLAVLDKNKHPHPPSPYHVYKIFIECEITGGSLVNGHETTDVAFFSIDEIPVLSEERVTLSQVYRLFEMHNNGYEGVDFD